MKGQPLLERFEEKIDKSGANGCWLWTSANDGRYGVFWLYGHNSYAHRLSYLFYRGDIPADMLVCHHCDVTLCVNPQHLFIGTALDNHDDMKRKGRGPRMYGHHNPQAKLTVGDIVKIRELRAQGMLQREIAQRFCVRRECISKILRGNRWGKAVRATHAGL